MQKFFSVSELARELGCRPRDISDAFYRRWLDDTVTPIVSGRRLIPADYVPTIREVLCRHGFINREAL